MKQFEVVEFQKRNEISLMDINIILCNCIPDINLIMCDGAPDIVCGCDPNTYCGGEDIGCEVNQVAPRKYI